MIWTIFHLEKCLIRSNQTGLNQGAQETSLQTEPLHLLKIELVLDNFKVLAAERMQRTVVHSFYLLNMMNDD